MKTTVLHAPDIMCGGCAASIQKALADVDGIGGVVGEGVEEVGNGR